ncbi:MAG: hypothetical protein P0Y53_06025 [Candidatus Pseudobacter hemicellulosilyticus]|uniref:DNA methylase n=1 Tax=Candidatus Pseudobacter hemicellulosilyticus TaxID=3121375 RepID=A0AAJ6BIN5_9BACT|nr:MAG: hypothetical protein P0Y53_06025 [Pseudobacter sp.]
MDKWVKMAISYSHKFGQLIGDLLEVAIEPFLEQFAKNNGLFLDRKGERRTRKGKKLTWIDVKDNKHDLDFVLERGGTDERLGIPVAFIETAWRRYTKHSRNKAQEIQGAIIPLLEKYSNISPFAGVILAGEFTQGSLTQLKSQGFSVLYFSYKSVIQAFKLFGIDAAFDEDTPEEEFKKKLEAIKKIGDIKIIARELMKINLDEALSFIDGIKKSISRTVINIIIWPLHGASTSLNSIVEAIKFLKNYSEDHIKLPFIKYEIIVKYNTGTVINATCSNRLEALDFLERHVGR